MRRHVVSTVGLLFLAAVCFAADKEKEKPVKAPAAGGGGEKVNQLLIKQEDYAAAVTYALMSAEDFDKLLQTIDKENKLFEKAMSMAKKDWMAGEDTKKKPFPSSSISHRKATKVAAFDNQQKADDSLSKYQDKASEDEKRSQAKKKDADKSKPKDKADKDATRERERDMLIAEARTLFEAKLQELMNAPAPGDKAANPAPPAK